MELAKLKKVLQAFVERGGRAILVTEDPKPAGNILVNGSLQESQELEKNDFVKNELGKMFRTEIVECSTCHRKCVCTGQYMSSSGVEIEKLPAKLGSKNFSAKMGAKVVSVIFEGEGFGKNKKIKRSKDPGSKPLWFPNEVDWLSYKAPSYAKLSTNVQIIQAFFNHHGIDPRKHYEGYKQGDSDIDEQDVELDLLNGSDDADHSGSAAAQVASVSSVDPAGGAGPAGGADPAGETGPPGDVPASVSLTPVRVSASPANPAAHRSVIVSARQQTPVTNQFIPKLKEILDSELTQPPVFLQDQDGAALHQGWKSVPNTGGGPCLYRSSADHLGHAGLPSAEKRNSQTYY